MSRNERLNQGVRGRKILEILDLNLNTVAKLSRPTQRDYEEIFGNNHPLAGTDNTKSLVPELVENIPQENACSNVRCIPTCPEDAHATPYLLNTNSIYSADDVLLLSTLSNCHSMTIPKSWSLSDLTNDDYCPTSSLKKTLSVPLLTENITVSTGIESPSVLLNFHRVLLNENVDQDSETETDLEIENTNDFDNIGEGRKRRQKALPSSWKRNKAKLRRMQGDDYLGYSKPANRKFQQDTLRTSRKLGERCTSDFCAKSRLRNCSKITDECRENIHTHFWKKMNWDQRKVYVNSLVQRSKTIQKTTSSDQSRRLETISYFLPSNIENTEKLQVCKQMFMSTLSLGSFTIYSWTKKSLYGMSTSQEIITPLRSSSERPETMQKIKTLNYFLDSLPKLPSHYARKETTKLFIEPLYQSLADLYKSYKKYCTEKEEPSLSRFTFEKHFRIKNLSLYTLKKDMCDVCSSFKAGNLDESDYQIHLIKKNRARKEKEIDKVSAAKGEFILLSMDLEAVKVCPFLTASALYFKTKLTVHNFTVFNLISKHCTCYWFDETAADLTSSTFVSFLIDYIERHCIQQRLPIVIYSDGCTYQNRNAIMANALLNLSKKYNTLIVQTFLEPGHTQMECDSVHAAIERKLKNKEIHLPSDYATLSKEVRSTNPYEVIQIDHQFVKNYAVAETHFYKSIRPGRRPGDPQVVDIRGIKYNTMTIEIKLNFDEDWVPLPQRPKIINGEIVYHQLKNTKIPIKMTKFNHLQQLKAVLPNDCHAFYDALPFE